MKHVLAWGFVQRIDISIDSSQSWASHVDMKTSETRLMAGNAKNQMGSEMQTTWENRWAHRHASTVNSGPNFSATISHVLRGTEGEISCNVVTRNLAFNASVQTTILIADR